MTAGTQQHHPATRPRHLCGAIPAALVALTAALPAAAQTPSLTYQLAVGDRLVYRREAVVRANDSGAVRQRIVDDVQCWCLAEEDGQKLLLIQLVREAGAEVHPARGAVLYVTSRGERRWPDEMPPRLAPLLAALDVLPVLPVGAQQPTAWVSPPTIHGRRWHCRNVGPAAEGGGTLTIDVDIRDPLNAWDVLGRQRAGRFWFDPRRGRLRRATYHASDARAGTETEVVAELRDVLDHSAPWCARRADEVQRYLQALRVESRLHRSILDRPEKLDQWLEQLDQLWAGFRSDVDSRANSPLATLADAHRQYVRHATPALRARAALATRWLNRPAGTWTLQDPAGETVPCEDLRNGVVIECFWSADAAPGLLALQSWRQTQAAMPRGAVTLLCCNLDRDPMRARAAIAACGDDLRHVLAAPLLQVETVPELPVVRVIDAAGIVRGVWVGWQPDYLEAARLAVSLAGRPWP